MQSPTTRSPRALSGVNSRAQTPTTRSFHASYGSEFPASYGSEHGYYSLPRRQSIAGRAHVYASYPPPPDRFRRQHSGPDGCSRSGGATYELVPDSDSETQNANCAREYASNLLADLRFNMLMAGMIVANAFVIGLETDSPNLPCWAILENLFLAAFLLELGLRMFVLGPRTYFDHNHQDFFWNIFDFTIIVFGIFDDASSVIPALHSEASSEGVPTLFRLLRLLRILRILRIVRYLRELYMLTFGFAAAAMAIKNITILMFLMLYVCSIVLARTVSIVPQGDTHREFLVRRFGHIGTCMLTLFELMSQPDLSPYHEVMWEHPLIASFLIGFVIWGSLGMIALLTGVISETMFDKNEMRLESERLEREARRKSLRNKCEDIFNKLELNDMGEAAPEIIMEIMPQLQEAFELEGYSFASSDLEGVVKFMDTNYSGNIDKDEFFRGVLQIAEGVRPMSIMELQYTVCFLKFKLEKFEVGLHNLQQTFSDSLAFNHRTTASIVSLDKQVNDIICPQLSDLAVVAKRMVSEDFLTRSLEKISESTKHLVTKEAMTHSLEKLSEATRHLVTEEVMTQSLQTIREATKHLVTEEAMTQSLEKISEATKNIVTEKYLTHSLYQLGETIREAVSVSGTALQEGSSAVPFRTHASNCNSAASTHQALRKQDDDTSVTPKAHVDVAVDGGNNSGLCAGVSSDVGVGLQQFAPRDSVSPDVPKLIEGQVNTGGQIITSNLIVSAKSTTCCGADWMQNAHKAASLGDQHDGKDVSTKETGLNTDNIYESVPEHAVSEGVERTSFSQNSMEIHSVKQ